jgi:LuxR family transcriptional regulator, maltose regulon positive regulatory protein
MHRGYALRVDASPREHVGRPGRDQPARSRTPFELLESKLHPPSARSGIVLRPALVNRLLASQTAPIICVVAPPGYGKTTLLAQWAERQSERVDWVSVDRHDNDPVVLLTYLAVALGRIQPIDPGVFQTALLRWPWTVGG